MLVQAVFLVICVAAVVFMLRFLLALNSEMKSERTYPLVRVEPLSRRTAHDAVLPIRLVHSQSRLVLRPNRVGAAASVPFENVQREQTRQYKGA